jgi:aconitase A
MENNPFESVKKELTVGDQSYHYYSLPELNDARVEKLPYSLLEYCLNQPLETVMNLM